MAKRCFKSTCGKAFCRVFRATALVAGFARSSKVRISANGTVDMDGEEGRLPFASCFSIKVIGVSLERVKTPVTMNGIGKITAKLNAKKPTLPALLTC